MKAIYARGNSRTVTKLAKLKSAAQKDSHYRVATRLHAIMLSVEGHTSTSISDVLKVDRTRVPKWIKAWNEHGVDGLLEGHRSGRKKRMSKENIEKLSDIIESGPVSYGLNTGVWTSPIITEVIRLEFDITYHPGHVRKILKDIGFSVQRPTYKLINADPKKKNRWVRYTYPNLKKTPRQRRR